MRWVYAPSAFPLRWPLSAHFMHICLLCCLCVVPAALLLRPYLAGALLVRVSVRDGGFRRICGDVERCADVDDVTLQPSLTPPPQSPSPYPSSLASSGGLLCAAGHWRARACRSRPLRSSVAIPVAKKGAPLSCMRSYKYVPVVHLVTCVVAPTRISLRLPRCIHSKCDSQRYIMRLRLRNGANKVKRHRTRFSIDRFSTL